MFFCCPRPGVSRRGLMLGTAASLATQPRLFAAGVGTTWIDAHTHIFNAIDLPITDFIAETRSSWVTTLLEPVIFLIAHVMRLECPTAQSEAHALRLGESRELMAQNPQEISALQVLRFMNQPTKFPLPPPAPGFRRPPMPINARFLIQEAIYLLLYSHPVLVQGVIADNDLKKLAKRMDPKYGSLINKNIIGLFGWADDFAASRHGIVKQLAKHYPHARHLLVVAAWVDFSRPLGIEGGSEREPTSIEDQIAVSAALTRSFARKGSERRMLIANFAPFDPMRSLLLGPGEEDPLDLIEHALTLGQIVGVKLYPPMGFRAIGNASLAGECFPELVRHQYGTHSGKALDCVLERLYNICVNHDAPIMTHCGDSNFPAKGYGLRANPVYWIELLDNPKYQNLRVNLGHFGGVWSFGNYNKKDGAIAGRWAQVIAKALTNEKGRYPNLYTDVAFASNLLVSGTKGSDRHERCDANAYLRRLLRRGNFGKRLMYGSDWQMVGQEKLEQQYSDLVDNDISAVLPAAYHEDFRWKNAARFMGLAKGQRTHNRLANFLGEDADILHAFDPTV